jgi:hypothetical protein
VHSQGNDPITDCARPRSNRHPRFSPGNDPHEIDSNSSCEGRLPVEPAAALRGRVVPLISFQYLERQ